MSPIRVEIEGHRFIDDETFAVGEKRVRNLGGYEGLEVARPVEGKEFYWVRQIDSDHPDLDQGLQKVVVSEGQPSGHFFVGDTRISAEYIKSGN